jgi:hypothetical protein
MGTFIVLVGNPVDGLTFVGPFATREEAEEFIGENVGTFVEGTPMTIAQVRPPGGWWQS